MGGGGGTSGQAGHVANGVGAAHVPGGRRFRWIALAAALLALALSSCAGAPASSQLPPAPTATRAVGTAPSGTPTPTATIGPTPVAITDLNAFRARLASAFQSNTWGKLAPLLSPAFSFQGLNSGGSSLEMPDSAHDLHDLYASGGPWSQSAQYEVTNHYCYGGGTPTSQQMGFDGGSGNFILVGIARWQGYWVVAWAFQDPLGGSDGCASG
jgi:hypothetical protein